MSGEGQNEPCHSLRRHGRSTSGSGPASRRSALLSRAKCGLMHRRKDRCSFDHVLGPAVTVGSPVYFGNMVGEVKTFFDNWLLNRDRHLVNTDHCARRTPACFARKSSMLRPPARFGKCHLPPITAYPWISILASGTASAVMVIRALPGKLSPNTSRRICVRRSP